MEPTESDGWSSLSGVQVWPASVVFHTPPRVAPRYTTLGSNGRPLAWSNDAAWCGSQTSPLSLHTVELSERVPVGPSGNEPQRMGTLLKEPVFALTPDLLFTGLDGNQLLRKRGAGGQKN